MATRLTLFMVLAMLSSGSALAQGLRIHTPQEAASPPSESAPDMPALPDGVAEVAEAATPGLRLITDSKEKAPTPDVQKSSDDVEEDSSDRSSWGYGEPYNDPTGIEFGLRAGSLMLADDWITGNDNALYGGVGYTMRYRFLPEWGLELSMDILGRESESGRVSEVRFNGAIGGIYYFGVPHWVQGFTTFGLAFNSTELDFEGSEPFSGSYQEYGVYSGIGVELLLAEWRIDTELRLLGLSRSDDEEYPWRGPYSREAPDFRVGIQWLLGVSYSL